ncbi:MAG: DUF551 domain-containing protein [Candidatus Altiarchaeales archaeon]|nr:DUF551 domain-containing protein [Candidatus Altiarchaeales archaeon]
MSDKLISVHDEIPEEHRKVILYGYRIGNPRCIDYFIGYRVDLAGEFFWQLEGHDVTDIRYWEITHWAKLPKLEEYQDAA